MKYFFLMTLLLIVSASKAQADTIIRWVDKEGKVHYGDKPAEDAIKTEQKKFGSAPAASDDDLSYAARKAKQDFPVTLYVTENCIEACAKGRALLNKRGTPYTEKLLVTKDDIDAFKAKTGGSSVPVLYVGKTALTGFEAGQWDGELDIAGYPKLAPYGARPIPPAVVKPPIPVETAQ